MGELVGKAAIVLGIGAQHNIGSGIARRFATEGARVVIAGRDIAAIERVANECGGHAFPCNITRAEDVTALAMKTVGLHGRIDVAVNAVGRNLVKDSLEVSDQEIRAIVDVQLVGAFLFLQQMAAAMVHGGSIIQISSLTAVAVARNHAIYMATKAGADMLVRSFALDFGARGVRVNSIAPGGTLDAPMAQAVMQDPQALSELRERIPLRRVGTVEDIANAAVWLAGDRCFVSGEVIQVNGGAAIHTLR
jgi:NAD(P)-dependent dehydrogenase (short-subunit alcohol dehydrogenase family)